VGVLSGGSWPADVESTGGEWGGFVEVLLSVTNSRPTSINSSRFFTELLENTGADADDNDLLFTGGVDTSTYNCM